MTDRHRKELQAQTHRRQREPDLKYDARGRQKTERRCSNGEKVLHSFHRGV